MSIVRPDPRNLCATKLEIQRAELVLAVAPNGQTSQFHQATIVLELVADLADEVRQAG